MADRIAAHFEGNIYCEADECTEQINFQESVIGLERKPGPKAASSVEQEEAEAHYARAVNLIRGIEKRREPNEVSMRLEAACLGGLSAACEDIEGKNLTPPVLVELRPVLPTPLAVSHEVEGRMRIGCRLATDGILRDCWVLHSLPFMDRQVAATLPTWRYRPAAYKGEPVEVTLFIELFVDSLRQ